MNEATVNRNEEQVSVKLSLKNYGLTENESWSEWKIRSYRANCSMKPSVFATESDFPSINFSATAEEPYIHTFLRQP